MKTVLTTIKKQIARLCVAAAAIAVFVAIFSASETALSPTPKILYREDGGRVEIIGNDVDVRDFNSEGKLIRHIYQDLSGARHTIVYDADGDVISHDKTE